MNPALVKARLDIGEVNGPEEMGDKLREVRRVQLEAMAAPIPAWMSPRSFETLQATRQAEIDIAEEALTWLEQPFEIPEEES